MRVTVKLFARLRELVGAGELERFVAPGATVSDVWQALVADHPDIAAYGGSISCAVNTEYARMSAPVGDGDEIAFLPPVSGGENETGLRNDHGSVKRAHNGTGSRFHHTG